MLSRNGDFLVRITEPRAGEPRAFVLSVMFTEERQEAGVCNLFKHMTFLVK